MAREPLKVSIVLMIKTGLMLLGLGVLMLLAYATGMCWGLAVWVFNLPMRLVRWCRG